jgi:pimeloyl-ACP methyl ester carboxylesterase
VRREVFFFASGSDRLYGSLYAAAEPHLDVRLVFCTGWGHDLLHLNELGHAVALGVCRAGGTALLFHPPGHGDSTGRSEDLTIERHVAAATDAAAEGARRIGEERWDFAGLRIGASVAVLAAVRSGARLLTLIDPALDPTAYFEGLHRRARRLALGRAGELTLLGHPLPERAASEHLSPTPLEALDRFVGRGAVVRFAQPPAATPGGLDEVVLAGKFSTPPGPKEQARLAAAAVEWISASAMAEVAS